MQFIPMPLQDAFVIELDLRDDHRGFFARAWCREEFAAHGLSTRIVQCNIGYSSQVGTLRGIHFQGSPHAEVKVVRCCRGSVYDVLVDLRPNSATYLQWASEELSEDNWKMLYIPEGFGHGYQTLSDHTEILYQTSEFYRPELARGIRYDDPMLGIDWPLEVTAISDSDRSWPDLQRGALGCLPQPVKGHE